MAKKNPKAPKPRALVIRDPQNQNSGASLDGGLTDGDREFLIKLIQNVGDELSRDCALQAVSFEAQRLLNVAQAGVLRSREILPESKKWCDEYIDRCRKDREAAEANEVRRSQAKARNTAIDTAKASFTAAINALDASAL